MMPDLVPAIALADCNNFFVSCERSVDPLLENQPVVVLSNNDGCIIARSNEAKLLGIRMGEPYFKIRAQLARQRVRVFSSNFKLYLHKSVQVADCLSRFTSQLEFYSIDESFLDLTAIPRSLLKDYALEIQETVRRETGIPISIGMAETKTLAKLANVIAKKNARFGGLLNLYQSPQRDMVLSRFPVASVWGVGRRISASLQQAGIFTARELRDATNHWILKRYNTTLLHTVLELRGQPSLPLRQARPLRKSVIYSRSFGSLIESREQLESVISCFTARAAEKLREDGMQAQQLSVYICTSRHLPHALRYSGYGETVLTSPTDCTPDLIRAALGIVRKTFRENYGYYKAVIGLQQLTLASEKQINLFDHRDLNRLDTLMKTLDRINGHHGSGTLRFGSEGLSAKGIASAWDSRHAFCSEAGLQALSNLPPISNRRPLLGFVHPVHG